jgi:hypothetical protein
MALVLSHPDKVSASAAFSALDLTRGIVLSLQLSGVSFDLSTRQGVAGWLGVSRHLRLQADLSHSLLGDTDHYRSLLGLVGAFQTNASGRDPLGARRQLRELSPDTVHSDSISSVLVPALTAEQAGQQLGALRQAPIGRLIASSVGAFNANRMN